ncbi:Membrane protein involved in the export of O-antigen and teichoic acid [Modestobacter sp. DSM 44400]|uniref:lipopolysaccharide biosynthesis protein n=1 Tax=Modestobacter sp. DSM 44400 TaxID=1550230 RepID=UPI00089CC0B3|nr:lipopolysaccharide biosynthesis protein [Modestobacter sp. DSM 44400]SDY79668.1 Membrane protein involved in the export of O-antigen and teichoic acid [Modestobacter sp. DSM 44400]
MSTPGSNPTTPVQDDVSDTRNSLAEDALDLQHPVLRRLQPQRDLGSGVRRGATWAAGGKIIGQVIQFLGTIITARLLLPEDYGKAAIVLPLVAFAAIFSSLGLGSAVIHSRRVTEKLLSTAFWVNAVTGVLITALVAALAVPLAHLFDEPLLTPLLLVGSLNFTLSLNVVHTSLLERTLRFKQIAVLETVCSVLSIGTVVVAAIAGAGPFALVLGPLTYTIVRTLLSWAVVRWLPRARPDRASVRELWAFTRGITGFNILIFWSRNADNLLLAGVASQAALGNYSRAYNLMKLPVGQIQVVMNRVLFPALTRLRDDRPRLARAWLRALSVSGLAAAPIAIGMAVAAPAMVEVLFGRRWLGMVTVLELLAVSALPQTLTATVGGLLRATGATDSLFRLGLVVSGLRLAAMVAGLPWGTVGVATALMIVFYAETLIFARPCLRETGLTWRQLLRAVRGVWVSCCALAVAGLAVRVLFCDVWPAWQVLLAQLAACAVAYVATLAVVERPTLTLAINQVRRLRRR